MRYILIQIRSQTFVALWPRASKDKIEVVVGILWVASCYLSGWRHLSNMSGRKILSVYAEKERGHFIFKRDYSKIVAGKNVLVVEDIINTGGTAKDIVDFKLPVLMEESSGSAICNRRCDQRDLDHSRTN